MTREELLSIAKPILFNSEMVKAILGGRKTVTRRVLKLPKHITQNENGLYTLFAEGTCYENQSMEEVKQYIKPPFKKGDYMYVRETWCDDRQFTHDDTAGQYFFKASFPIEGWSDVKEFKWRPSIHMPKEAARIFLKVTDVRVERLVDITDKQAKQEGVVAETNNSGIMHKVLFIDLWNSTIKKQDLDTYGWDANPWVWVIEFERVEV